MYLYIKQAAVAEPKVGLSTIHYQSLLCFLGGIIQHHCSTGSLDHAVQIVGYDTTGTVQYVYIAGAIQ